VNVPSWLVINGYSFVFLVMLVLFTVKNRENKTRQQRLFRFILLFLMVLLVSDTLSRLPITGPVSRFVVIAGNFLIFLLDPLMIFVWTLYAGTWCGVDLTHKRHWFIPFWIFCTLNEVMTVMTLWTGSLFWFDAAGVYHRGPLFLARAILMLLGLIYLEVFVIANRFAVEGRYSRFFFSLPLIPLVGGVLQTVFYGLSLGYAGATVALLVVHVFAQNQDINIDYLTGADNRRRLDFTIKEKVKAHTMFSAIMLDIDHFKAINDTYGHGMGDIALQDTVTLLHRSVPRDAMIARYGGDEFCVVLDIRDKEKLDLVVEEIGRQLDAYNAKHPHPFHLGFSIGCDVFDPYDEMDAEEFQRHIDVLMYQRKLLSHSQQ